MNYVLLDGGNFLLIKNYPNARSLLVIPLITASAFISEDESIALAQKPFSTALDTFVENRPFCLTVVRESSSFPKVEIIVTTDESTYLNERVRFLLASSHFQELHLKHNKNNSDGFVKGKKLIHEVFLRIFIIYAIKVVKCC